VHNKVLKTDDLNPDGVKICVDWELMGVNKSVFIPCINTEEATRQVKEVFTRRKWQSEVRVLIEDDKLGIRVWRTL